MLRNSLVFVVVVVMMIMNSSSSSELAAKIELPGNLTVRAVFAFGDSIVDQGNNNYIKTIAKCNFPPYGKDFKGGIPTGRFSNGRTPPDLIAEELGVKELVHPYLDPNLSDQDLSTGVSFASGGAGYDPLTSQLSLALSMSDQLELFKEYTGKLQVIVGEEETKNILENSLFLAVAGSDDLTNTYFLPGSVRSLQYDLPSYADFMLSYTSDFVKGLYSLGARKIAVFGIPPIGCLPSQKTLTGQQKSSCSSKYNHAAQLVNSKLSSEMDFLTKTLPDSRIIYIDIYNPVINIINNPDRYGIDVVEKGCCGTGRIEVTLLCNKFTTTCEDDTKYLFWDSFHPTEMGYQILIDSVLRKYVNKFV